MEILTVPETKALSLFNTFIARSSIVNNGYLLFFISAIFPLQYLKNKRKFSFATFMSTGFVSTSLKDYLQTSFY